MRAKTFEPIEELRIEAAKVIDTYADNLQFHAWEESFGSTAGPRTGVVAGQAFTSFTVYAFVNFDGRAALYCADVWKVVESFNPEARSWHRS